MMRSSVAPSGAESSSSFSHPANNEHNINVCANARQRDISTSSHRLFSPRIARIAPLASKSKPSKASVRRGYRVNKPPFLARSHVCTIVTRITEEERHLIVVLCMIRRGPRRVSRAFSKPCRHRDGLSSSRRSGRRALPLTRLHGHRGHDADASAQTLVSPIVAKGLTVPLSVMFASRSEKGDRRFRKGRRIAQNDTRPRSCATGACSSRHRLLFTEHAVTG